MERTQLEVAGVPEGERKNAAAIKRYLDQTFINEEQHKRRSWKFASLTTAYACNASGQITHILVIERESGKSIRAGGGDADQGGSRDVVGAEMAFAAEVWAIAGDN